MVSRAACLERLATGDPTRTSSAPLHFEKAIWNAPSRVLKRVVPLRRTRSWISPSWLAAILESHRLGAPGVIGAVQIRRAPARFVLQYSARSANKLGCQNARSVAPQPV